MKKVMTLFLVLGLVLLTGCSFRIQLGHKVVGSIHTKEEIIKYVDNLAKCGKDLKDNCNLSGKYTITSSSDEVDENGEVKSRKVNFKLNDYNIEFSAESVLKCTSEFSASCTKSTWTIKTDYANKVRTHFIEEFLKKYNVSSEYISDYECLKIEDGFRNHEKTFDLIIKNRNSVPVVVDYVNKYVNFINEIQNNNGPNFDVFDASLLVMANNVKVSSENPRPHIVISKNNSSRYSAYYEDTGKTDIAGCLYNYLDQNNK